MTWDYGSHYEADAAEHAYRYGVRGDYDGPTRAEVAEMRAEAKADERARIAATITANDLREQGAA